MQYRLVLRLWAVSLGVLQVEMRDLAALWRGLRAELLVPDLGRLLGKELEVPLVWGSGRSRV